MPKINKSNEENIAKVRNLIKGLVGSHGTTITKLVELLNKKYNRKVSQSSFSNRLSRGTIYAAEIFEILDILNCDLKIEDKK